MCKNTCTLTKRSRPHESAPDLSPTVKKNLQPYTKSPIGHFTAKSTSPEKILDKHKRIDAQKTLVAQVGLENFIRSIVNPLDLQLPDRVKFNMNGQGRLQSWDDVYLAEQVYTRCLGISKRIYQTHAFTHEPDKKLAYFILEEHNERSLSFLPGFDFYVLVFTYYDDQKNVTRVDVQYDQMSFFLHCLGLAQLHAWFLESVITPLVLVWARTYHASGLVNPFTFLLQLMIVPLALVYWLLWA
mmetsp:Transcript_29168/g.62024  ORF Transcript_29168/g.62024 Transcript_29168/m.62024 type:complete len:242 (-) Transcript_29168:169-894(-)|eukprot:CAMPEP_0172313070 /NCGR_PEP_ID=MMETSP1058-20130122/19283_1 /TAXON_ID=83371 /ORGANISM="Detonula confervacea, Strain CCMP 353" /LENGTH=241 /DNA_ID=CAMNT_0013026659 /DNA_START=157 /DNA_END=882 /DNA_ORIENTATION=-